MTTISERLQRQCDEARKDLEKWRGKREDAIRALIRADARLDKAQKALGRVEKRKAAARAEARRASKDKTAIPPL